MPTGYTAKIEDGISFVEFAWGCARGMGALIEMRDAPFDAPIPERFQPSDYHKRGMEEATRELQRLLAMTADDADKAAREAHAARHKDWVRSIDRNQRLREKYEAMLGEVRAWRPPTPDHEGLKTFMIEQLETSIEFDCGANLYRAAEPQPETGEQWRMGRIANASRDIDYHHKEYLAEVDRVEARNAWVAALRRSLQPTDAAGIP